MSGVVKVLIGTTKGAFILTSTDGRASWSLSGPHCDLWSINHVIGAPETGNLWAGGGGDWTGAGIWRSTDAGESWALSQLSNGMMAEWAANDPGFAEMIGGVPPEAPYASDLVSIWSLTKAHGKLYAGSKPANLFTSNDGGATWDLVSGLADDPTRDSWNPGGAGLTLHTLLPHPKKPGHMTIAISAAGVFSTEDDGATWERTNRLDNAEPHAHHDHEHAHEIGHCVHNMMRAPSDAGLIYQQNHQGVFRSNDGGQNWHDISAGLPSTFGFPIAVHPHDPATIWTIPLNGDTQGRYPPDAKAAVWRSTDAGDSWEAMRTGLPQENCFFTVLRQAMATDTSESGGIYFGTNSGSIFASTDGGDSWSEIAKHLPTVLSVETLEPV
ncbi:MAG: exo-alpha-sialidase [Pseudomonadota bacterium]|nr:exo-alpha-sialidase [Pseudomonadota bacterium]